MVQLFLPFSQLCPNCLTNLIDRFLLPFYLLFFTAILHSRIPWRSQAQHFIPFHLLHCFLPFCFVSMRNQHVFLVRLHRNRLSSGHEARPSLYFVVQFWMLLLRWTEGTWFILSLETPSTVRMIHAIWGISCPFVLYLQTYDFRWSLPSTRASLFSP